MIVPKAWRDTLKTRFQINESGAAAVEFALIVPFFLYLIFGILELGLALLFAMMLSHANNLGVDYLIRQRMTYQTPTEQGLRDAVCAGLRATPLSCGSDKLKIAVVYAGVPPTGGGLVTFPIANAWDSTITISGYRTQYLVAVGYDWDCIFPTTVYVLPFSGPRAQIQTVNLAVVGERVTE